MIFDEAGSLIAHPDFAEFVVAAMTHPSQSQLPSISEINTGVVAAALRSSHNLDQNEGIVRDDGGRDYLFRLTKFALGERYSGSILAAGGPG